MRGSTEKSGQIETDSEINRIARAASRMRVATRVIQRVKTGVCADGNTVVACDIRGPGRIGRVLENAATGCSGRACGCTSLVAVRRVVFRFYSKT